MSVATLVLWIFCYIVSQTFPMLIERVGTGNCFLIYSIMSGLSLIFIFFMLPETRGRSLEQIQHAWLQNQNPALAP
jgi:hypothetical protein